MCVADFQNLFPSSVNEHVNFNIKMLLEFMPRMFHASEEASIADKPVRVVGNCHHLRGLPGVEGTPVLG